MEEIALIILFPIEIGQTNVSNWHSIITFVTYFLSNLLLPFLLY